MALLGDSHLSVVMSVLVVAVGRMELIMLALVALVAGLLGARVVLVLDRMELITMAVLAEQVFAV
jgi:hypothetical protein